MTWRWVNNDTVFIVWWSNRLSILDFISCPRIFHDVLNRVRSFTAVLVWSAEHFSLIWSQSLFIGMSTGILWRTYRWFWERRRRKMSENSTVQSQTFNWISLSGHCYWVTVKGHNGWLVLHHWVRHGVMNSPQHKGVCVFVMYWAS